MNKMTQILAEAQAAEEKAAALTSFMRTEEYKTLRIENTSLWFNILNLRGAYDTLAKYLKTRAELQEEAEKARERAINSPTVSAGKL